MEQVKGIRPTKVGTFEVTISHKLLQGGRVMRNFDDPEAAARYKVRMLDILNTTGQVPAELTREGVRAAAPTPAPKVTAVPVPVAVAKASSQSPALTAVIRDYLNSDTAQIAKSDRPMVEALQNQLRGTVAGVNTTWTDDWVRHMKRVDKLAPGTIRKKVEALARCIDWWSRKQHPNGGGPANVLRLLPKGYSAYQAEDVKPGDELPEDAKRDRRLHAGEYEEIEAVINGKKRPDRERAWGNGDAADFLMLFRLIVHTGLRLREAYRLRTSDIKHSLRTIHVRRSKTGKPRDVPMTRQLQGWLTEYVESAGRKGHEPVFPFWAGSDDEDVLRSISNSLSKRFRSLFDYAGAADLVEHDLRHEATCRWMELKDKHGRWLYRAEEVRRITGHKNVQMFERYLSLRGSDLADRLE